jgi:predicted transposase YdaD
MARDYDPTVKALVEVEPGSWLPLAGRPPAPVTVIDADVSALLSGAADKFLHVHADPEYVLHLDFQSGHDSAHLPRRLRLYNAVAGYRTGLAVRSTAVLLRPEADSPRLTGTLELTLPGDEPEEVFRYRVIRVWQLPVEPLLAGGLGTLPLAPISDVSQSQLPGVIRRMKVRLRRERRAKELWTATEVLLGLRYPPDLVDILLRGVTGMKESSTYQRIVAEGLAEGRTEGLAEGLAKGRTEEARRVLLLLGEEQFGAPDPPTRTAIDGIENVERLEQLIKQTRRAGSWQDLLGRSAPRRRNGRRKSGE